MTSSLNAGFVGVFGLEAACKLFSLGPRKYFFDSWNRFDFVVASISLVGLGVDTGVGANAVRVLRVGRVFRLIRRAQALQVMFNCLITTLPSLWNISALMGLIISVFAILGTSDDDYSLLQFCLVGNVAIAAFTSRVRHHATGSLRLDSRARDSFACSLCTARHELLRRVQRL